MDFIALAVASDVANYFRLGIAHGDAFAPSPLAESYPCDANPCFEDHDFLVFEALVLEYDESRKYYI